MKLLAKLVLIVTILLSQLLLLTAVSAVFTPFLKRYVMQ